MADQEHDVGGATNTVGVTYFSASTTLNSGEVGGCVYIKKPDPDQSPVVMASDPPSINQPASKPSPRHQRTCSLTEIKQGQVEKIFKDYRDRIPEVKWNVDSPFMPVPLKKSPMPMTKPIDLDSALPPP